MTAPHVFEGEFYVISNFAVARNQLFSCKSLCLRFLNKIDLYLSPLCDIHQYHLDNDQFHLLIKLKNRKAFETYYLNKKLDKNPSKIPHSTYIFSQAMANLQAGTAIHINRKTGRKGAMFARRFKKHLIESVEELEIWLKKFNAWKIASVQSVLWRYRLKKKEMRKKVKEYRESWRNGSSYYYNNNYNHPILRSFEECIIELFQGQFKKSSQSSLFSKKRNYSPP